MRTTRLAFKIVERWLEREAAVPFEVYQQQHPDTHMTKPEYERRYGPSGKPPKKHYEYKGGPKPQPEGPQPKPQDKSKDNQKRVEEQEKSGAKGHNGLQQPEYNKPGKEVSMDEVTKFVAEFHPAFVETESWHDDFLANGAQSFSGRLKDEKSLFTKMKGRFGERTLNSVGDVVGTRAICKNIQDQKKLIDFIYKNYDVLEHDNSVDKKIRPDGYRAHHFTLKSKDGKLIELQVKTPNQQAFAGYTHDTIYKGAPEVKNDPEVKKYTKALSDYIYAKDQGQQVGKPPEPPQILKDRNILFDHSELE